MYLAQERVGISTDYSTAGLLIFWAYYVAKISSSKTCLWSLKEKRCDPLWSSHMVNLKTKPVSEMYCLSEFPSHWVCAKMDGSYMSGKKEGV